MATYSKIPFSAPANYRPVKVAAVVTPGTLIHTSGGTDEIWLWVNNTSGADATLTIEFGDATSPDHHSTDALVVPAHSPPILVVNGVPLTSGDTLRVFSGSPNVLNVHGYVNRIA